MIRTTLGMLIAALVMVGCGDDNKVQVGPDNNVTANNTEPGVDGGQDMAADTDMGTANNNVNPGCGDDCAYEPAFALSDIQTTPVFQVTSIGGRELPVMVRVPADATEPLPVVIWSHGGSWKNGGHMLGDNWGNTIASAGYAVVHYSMVAPTEDQLAQICQIAGVTDPADCVDWSVTEDAPPGADASDNPFAATVIARIEDGHALLDALPQIATQLGNRGIDIDIERVAVAGHSAGTQTVLGLAGAVRPVSVELGNYSNPSDVPDAFLALSPQGPGDSRYFADDTATSWDAVRGPTLVMTGDGDLNPGNDIVGSERRLAFEHMPPDDKWLFYSTQDSQRINHGTFNLGDLDSADPQIALLNEALVSTALAHLDAQLRDRQQAREWLETDNVLTIVEGAGDWESK